MVSTGSTGIEPLLSFFTEEILDHILFMTTLAEVWAALERMFASRSRARLMHSFPLSFPSNTVQLVCTLVLVFFLRWKRPRPKRRWSSEQPELKIDQRTCAL